MVVQSFPGDDVAGLVVEHGRQVEPSPPCNLSSSFEQDLLALIEQRMLIARGTVFGVKRTSAAT